MDRGQSKSGEEEMIYRTSEEKAKRKADRNIIFLILFAVGMIWAGVHVLKMEEERLATETPSAETVTEVTRQLCVEIDDNNHLVVCPE